MTEPNDILAGVTRRNFLALSGLTAAGAAATAGVLGVLAGAPETTPLLDAQFAAQATHMATLRRPDDQCVLSFAFFNLTPDFSSTPPVLRQINANKPNYLSVTFGGPDSAAPMHVAEHAFPLQDGHLAGSAQQSAPTPVLATQAVASPAIGARAAGASRLVFLVPDAAVTPGAQHPLVYDAAHLLNWLDLTLSVAPNAVGIPPATALGGLAFGSLGAPTAPTNTQTAIELPYRLVISPPQYPVYGPVDPRHASPVVFVNAVAPVTHDGWTELWHTRLGQYGWELIGQPGGAQALVRVLDETSRRRTIRAIWCTDSNFAKDLRKNASEPTDGDPLFRSSLDYADRYDIVRLSADFTPASNGGPYGRQGFVPSPATVDLLMLSSLGGWLDADAHWDLANAPSTRRKPQYNSSLLSWRHRAVQGRDSYVRVVRKGYLFPWGHQASLITVTEREPTVLGNTVGAYLRQKTFIVLSDPVKTYGGTDDFAPHDGRKIPFTTVEARTLVTPDLAAPKRYTSKAAPKLVFQPMLDASTPFLFHFRGTDWAGDPVDFRSPVLWVDDTLAYSDSSSKPVIRDVIATWQSDYPTIELHNKRVSLATPKNPDAATGDTQVVVAGFELGANHAAGSTASQRVTASQPDFYPALHTVAVHHPEAATASGNAVPATTLEYETAHYLANGFTSNPGGLFLQRVTSRPRGTITFKGDHAGAAVTPNLGIDAISRELGPAAGDLTLLAAGHFDPKAVFAGVQAKLLGGLELSTILGLVHFGDDAAEGNTQALQLTSVERQNPHRIVTTLDWHPVVINGGPTVTVGGQQVQVTLFEVRDPDGQYPIDSSSNAQQVDGSSDSMDLHAVIVTDLDNPANSTSTVTGQLRDFNLDLFGKDTTYFIQIPFDSLTFRAQSGKKTDVDVQINADGVSFQGPLSFVQQLADYLSFDGSGLVIDTAGSAITAELTLAIPSLGVGVFALENLAFSAGVAIPYNGDPVRFDFAFCSRENPFQLEIMMFTGGGFVGLGIGADGVELLEFSFDFGLGISVDIGIASGQVSLVGGVYYESQKDGDSQDVQLTAYVKASGGISALGIVSVSIEFYLSLNYESDGSSSQLSGTAEMSISVHILFFGGTVGFSVQETFAGSPPSQAGMHTDALLLPAGGGPRALDAPAGGGNTFGDVFSPADWDAYCTSFALIGTGN